MASVAQSQVALTPNVQPRQGLAVNGDLRVWYNARTSHGDYSRQEPAGHAGLVSGVWHICNVDLKSCCRTQKSSAGCWWQATTPSSRLQKSSWPRGIGSYRRTAGNSLRQAEAESCWLQVGLALLTSSGACAATPSHVVQTPVKFSWTYERQPGTERVGGLWLVKGIEGLGTMA